MQTNNNILLANHRGLYRGAERDCSVVFHFAPLSLSLNLDQGGVTSELLGAITGPKNWSQGHCTLVSQLIAERNSDARI